MLAVILLRSLLLLFQAFQKFFLSVWLDDNTETIHNRILRGVRSNGCRARGAIGIRGRKWGGGLGKRAKWEGGSKEKGVKNKNL